MAKDVTLALKIPVGLSEEIDRWVKKLNYQNRSEMVRAAIREFIATQEERTATLATGYKSESSEISRT